MPVQAKLPIPNQGSDAATAQHARTVAARLHAGADVIALGWGLELGTLHQQPVLRLIRCISVTPVAMLVQPELIA
jgi:hypothetical protein